MLKTNSSKYPVGAHNTLFFFRIGNIWHWGTSPKELKIYCNSINGLRDQIYCYSMAPLSQAKLAFILRRAKSGNFVISHT